jgi:hypothetical protein
VGIYLFTHEWSDIQQVLVVPIVLKSGYLFIYTEMVWYTTCFSGTCCLKEWVFIYLHMNGLIYTSFSGTCCLKEWVFICLHMNGLIYDKL